MELNPGAKELIYIFIAINGAGWTIQVVAHWLVEQLVH